MYGTRPSIGFQFFSRYDASGSLTGNPGDLPLAIPHSVRRDPNGPPLPASADLLGAVLPCCSSEDGLTTLSRVLPGGGGVSTRFEVRVPSPFLNQYRRAPCLIVNQQRSGIVVLCPQISPQRVMTKFRPNEAQNRHSNPVPCFF